MEFNVSHSGDLALIAVLPGSGRVGVDVEWLVDRPNLLDLASTVATPRELAQLALESRRQLESFYRLWTRKEAYLKAIGTGLSADARNVQIGVSSSARVLQRVAPDGRAFEITTFFPRPGFVAALAVSAN